ncbi:MAG TPA: XdhC family protein [Thermoanaerobaculia bacterium]|nr:XdhC family protein [Thermoanaerobaculia bacterium]
MSATPGPDGRAGELDALAARARAGGERYALATVLEGAHAGARLLVWGAGHCFGDLGWPRLNQRVALYAEQLLERAAVEPTVKRFEVPGSGRIEVRVEPNGPAR